MRCCSVFGLSIIRSLFGVLACAALLLAGTTINEASGAPAPICKPALTVKDVNFSAVNPETMLRTWTAKVVADASGCASAGGSFEMLFTRLMENGPDADFTEQFEWKPGAIHVAVEFWADEAVEYYRITRVTECPCRR